MFAQNSYLAYILIFAGGTVLIEWLFQWRLLLKYKKIFLIGIPLVVIYTFFADNTASIFQTWIYHPERMLNIFVAKAPIESFIFAVIVGSAIAGGALFLSEAEQKGLNLLQMIKFFFLKK